MVSASACEPVRVGPSSSAAAPRVASVSASPSLRSSRLRGVQSFPKHLRLRKRVDYLTVQRRGRKVQGQHFLLLHLLSGDEARVGVTVSTKVGGATIRNRVKRWVREYLRRHRSELPVGDTVLVARPSAAAAAHDEVDRDLARMLGRMKEARR